MPPTRSARVPPTANEITTELLLRASQELPDVWLWRNNRFVGEAVGAGGKTRYVSAGINGQGDLSGILAPAGRRIEIEIKAEYGRGRDTQSMVQQAFQKRVKSMGGVYLLAERIGWTSAGKPDVGVVMEQLRKVN